MISRKKKDSKRLEDWKSGRKKREGWKLEEQKIGRKTKRRKGRRRGSEGEMRGNIGWEKGGNVRRKVHGRNEGTQK